MKSGRVDQQDKPPHMEIDSKMRNIIRNVALTALLIAMLMVVLGAWIKMLPITLLGFAIGTVVGLPAGYIWFLVGRSKKGPSSWPAEAISWARTEVKKRMAQSSPEKPSSPVIEGQVAENKPAVRVVSSIKTEAPPAENTPIESPMPENPATPVPEVSETNPPLAVVTPPNGNGNGHSHKHTEEAGFQIKVRVEPTAAELAQRAEEERRKVEAEKAAQLKAEEEERLRLEAEKREAEKRQREELRRQDEARKVLIEEINAAGEEKVAWVVEQLEHDHPLVRVSAVQALRRIDGADSVAPLNKALEDMDEVVRRAARIALRELGHEVNKPSAPAE